MQFWLNFQIFLHKNVKNFKKMFPNAHCFAVGEQYWFIVCPEVALSVSSS